MKKISILLLALAFAVAFTVPAMAGDFTMSGKAKFAGEAVDEDGAKEDLFEDDIDLDLDLTEGDVRFHWDIEVTDDEMWPSESGSEAGLVDNFYVHWDITDAVGLRLGEWGFGWGNDLVLDGPTDKNIQVTYGMDGWDFGFINSQVADAGEDEDVLMVLWAEGSDLGFVDNFGLVYLNQTAEGSGGDEHGLIGFYVEAPIGPVGFELEYGSQSSDDDTYDGGTVMLVGIGLDDLVGFGLGIGYLQSNEEWQDADNDDNVFGNDYDFMEIWGIEGGDAAMIKVEAEYGVNDNLSVSGAFMVSCEVAGGDDAGTEIDVAMEYGLADNVTYAGGYATYSEGDDYGVDTDKLWHEIVFEF